MSYGNVHSLLGARGMSISGGNSGPTLLDSVLTNAEQYPSNWNASYAYIGAYIDTGYKATPDTTLDVECGWDEFQAQNWDSPVGSGASGVFNTSLVAFFKKWDGTKGLCAFLLDKRYAQENGVLLSAPTGIMRFILGPQDGFKVWDTNGNLLYSENPIAPPTTGAQYSLYIGATNYGGKMVNPMIGRIRRVTISENGTTIKNFLAAKLGDACGFYESLGGTFHQSASATAFTEGV